MAIDDGPVIVGGGPAGLAAAIELRELGISPVTVIEREREAGGIPRHSDHTGFGLRDQRTVLSGPKYAARYRDLAEEAAVEVLTETMVTEWEGARQLKLTGPHGRWEIEPPAVVLATGCRERPRSARLVPGSRPPGVMTTATLQQLVHLRGRKVGRRAVIVGAEHVSFSAVATLAHGGASVAGLVTELPKHQSLRAFRAGAAVRYRAPVWSRTKVSAIHGSERVESVELTEIDSGLTRTVECDLVVFTADWIPDHELAVMAGCELDLGTRGPLVDPALRTTKRGVFGAGNLLHPAETADVCALDGRHVAPSVAAYLRGPGDWPATVRADGARSARLGRSEPAAGHRTPASARSLPSAFHGVCTASAAAGPSGRSGAVERPGRPARAGPLRPHPSRLGCGGRSSRRPRDRCGEIGLLHERRDVARD